MSPDLLRRSLARILDLLRHDAELLRPGPAELLPVLVRREAAIRGALAAAGEDENGLEILAGLVDMPRLLLFARLTQLSALVLVGEAVWLQASRTLARSGALDR